MGKKNHPRSDTEARAVEGDLKRGTALQLRARRNTFAEIGRALGCSRQRAHQLVLEKLRIRYAERTGLADQILDDELATLDCLFRKLDPYLEKDPPDLKAIEVALKICQQRHRLQGLDQSNHQDVRILALQMNPQHLLIEAERAGLPVTENMRKVLSDAEIPDQ